MSSSKHIGWGTVTIRLRETGEEQVVELGDLEVEWVWADYSRETAEYWAVVDAVVDTFGNNVDWFSVTSWGSSPAKGVNDEK